MNYSLIAKGVLIGVISGLITAFMLRNSCAAEFQPCVWPNTCAVSN